MAGDPPHLLVVYQSRSGSTRQLCEAVVAGIEEGGGDAVERRVKPAPDADIDDVVWADAVILGTPTHFGAMSGLLKDFFERVYRPLLDRTPGLPYALFVKGESDVDGAVSGVERIILGLRWRAVLPPLRVVGDLTDEHLAAAHELGATVAASLEAGLY